MPGFARSSRWLGDEPRWWQSSPSSLTLKVTGSCDRFFDPTTGERRADSPAWMSPFEAPATLVANVDVAFASTFDAGVLMVHHRHDRWAKLCFERAPDGHPMIVSVVTKGRSDDANAYTVSRHSAWLRVTALGHSYAFHASEDGVRWRLVRLFDLGRSGSPMLGLSVQAPVGDACTATFDDVGLSPGALQDIRGGG